MKPLAKCSFRFKMDDLFGDLPPPCKLLQMKIEHSFEVSRHCKMDLIKPCCLFCLFQPVEVTFRVQLEVCMMIFQLQKAKKSKKIKENSRMVVTMNCRANDLPRVRSFLSCFFCGTSYFVRNLHVTYPVN